MTVIEKGNNLISPDQKERLERHPFSFEIRPYKIGGVYEIRAGQTNILEVKITSERGDLVFFSDYEALERTMGDFQKVDETLRGTDLAVNTYEEKILMFILNKLDETAN